MARILKDYPAVSLKPRELDSKIDFALIFGRQSPVHIEIGSGKGTFLLNQAKALPDVDFLGIEWTRRFYRYAVDRTGRWSLTNVKLIRIDAACFIADFVPAESVECFHIYFPDPWPKKRHRKRRFICPANLEQILRCLKPDGIIKIATDHEDYFQQIKQVLAGQADGFQEIDFLPTAGAEQGEWVGTNFERKYLRENRPIYTTAVRKN